MSRLILRIQESRVLAATAILCAVPFCLLILTMLEPVAAQNGPQKRSTAAAKSSNNADTAGVRSGSPMVPDPKQVGGEPVGVVQVANLIYAGVKSSQCFSDHFLATAEKDSTISTSRRFHAVKLRSDELFNFPLVVMTGEGTFTLTDAERRNLRLFVERGGLLLSSAGCSSQEWNRSFRHEMATVFPKYPLSKIGMDHVLFKTVYEIKQLKSAHGTPRPIEGITIEGRLGVVYSQDGLNDTAHTQGCCCCGGNEITNSIQVNVNILAYSLVY